MALSYRVDLDDRHAHLFRVRLRVPRPAPGQGVSLPVWLPGSYLLREYARHLQDLQATQRGAPVAVEQTDKTRWAVRCDGGAPLDLQWRVHALDPSVRGAWLDGERGFFNGSSLFLAVDGRTHEPHRLTVGRLPAGWQLATAMAPGRGARAFEAADYAELIDHPFELGRFWRGGFTAGGVAHEFVVTGAWPGFDGARLLADAERVCSAHVRLWHGRGRPPFDRYLFLLRAGDEGGGGLEHRASTALLAPRRDLPRAGTAPHDPGYLRLLGLVSHEYFHAWNVKRLVAPELAAPDLGREAYTRLLWWFEGVTSYYDDLMLCRAGLIDTATALARLASHLDQVAASPGRRLQSVAQASFDAWTRLYRPDANTPNATVSYYAKGALVAACLDLSLRRDGRGTLDGVLRRLWRAAGAHRAVTEERIAAALAAEAGRSLQPELQAWVHGTDELPLPALLADMGVRVEATPAPLAASLGLRLSEGPVSGVQVRSVLRASAAERAGVMPGDELLAADGWRLRRLEDARAWLPAAGAFELLVAREQRVHTLRVNLPPAPAAPGVRLVPDPRAGADAIARRRAWLGS